MGAPVRYEVEGGIATLTMDRPENRNALTDELLDALLAAFERAKAADDVRVVVLASSHDRVWSAGGNLAGFADDRPIVAKYHGMDRFPRLFRLIGGLGKPVIAAVRGAALAGAFGITQACDLVITGDRARFGAPEITIGAFPFMISALIGRNVGRLRANELMLMGEPIDAARAVELGVANVVVPDADLDVTVTDWAGRLAGRSPLIMRLGKDAVERGWDQPLDVALDQLQAQLALAFSTEDLHEGVKAFFEKREPTWTGR